VLYSYEKFLAELGHRLREMRIARALTLRAMIVTHGFHLAQWQGFEKGKGISVPSLLRMCEVFDVSLEELIGAIGVADSNTDASAAVALSAEPPCEQPAKEPTQQEKSSVAGLSKAASSPDAPRPRSRGRGR